MKRKTLICMTIIVMVVITGCINVQEVTRFQQDRSDISGETVEDFFVGGYDVSSNVSDDSGDGVEVKYNEGNDLVCYHLEDDPVRGGVGCLPIEQTNYNKSYIVSNIVPEEGNTPFVNDDLHVQFKETKLGQGTEIRYDRFGGVVCHHIKDGNNMAGLSCISLESSQYTSEQILEKID